MSHGSYARIPRASTVLNDAGICGFPVPTVFAPSPWAKPLTLTLSQRERGKKGAVKTNLTLYEFDDYTTRAEVVYSVRTMWYKAEADAIRIMLKEIAVQVTRVDVDILEVPVARPYSAGGRQVTGNWHVLARVTTSDGVQGHGYIVALRQGLVAAVACWKLHQA